MSGFEGEPEIRPPPAVRDNPDAFELMRVWWMGDRAEMVFRPIYQDPRAFGFLLAEASQHLAHIYAERLGLDVPTAHAAILEGWTDGQTAEMVTEMEPVDQ